MNLIDTNVLVDCLRGTAGSKTWLSKLDKEFFAVPGVVAMELLMGCRDRVDLNVVRRFLATFDTIWHTAPEFAGAHDLLPAHRLTSGLGIPDYLIAALALSRHARLYTFNFKHFQTISGLDVQQPCSRP